MIGHTTASSAKLTDGLALAGHGVLQQPQQPLRQILDRLTIESIRAVLPTGTPVVQLHVARDLDLDGCTA
jgi:hypothetical protein